MNIQGQVQINASKEKIWEVITNIENAANNISGIESIEVLEQPKDNFVGLKWKEKRIMFGKEATETMWITDAKEPEYYTTRAENHGAIYTTKLSIFEQGGKNYLNMEFNGEAQTFFAKIMSAIMGFMMKNATKKALLQDLNDIKKVAETT